ncbi:fibroleukin-like [Saccostrea echinata]|uniref:fibroleukin-like n=1 Tax=Saccostrea echinata TaxID=191078 RepID=UPI002A80B266|nr:fibroleukin-like [Saccostrea echinata]
MCKNDCGFYGYNIILKKCRLHKEIYTSEISEETGWKYYSHILPTDCRDLREDGYTNTGVYEIYPYGNSSLSVRVFCDMDTMDGGWTAIQKRVDGTVSFEKNWGEYKNGFGAPETNIWIGNEVIHQLTKGKSSYLYVSITLSNGSRLYELYDRFSVSNETENYKLFLAGNATGSLGDSILNTGYSRYDLSGMFFTTSDRDNDRYSTGNCAVEYKGGWWLNHCYYGFLNGPWSSTNWVFLWYPTVTYGTSVKETMMLIKRH